MRSSRLWILCGVLLAAIAALVLLIGPVVSNEASCFSTGGRGLFLMRAYLEEKGTRCGTLPEDKKPDSALLISFPGSGRLSEQESTALPSGLRQGETLLLLYSTTGSSICQKALLERLGLPTRKLKRDSSINPITWWRERSTPVRLLGCGLSKPVLISSPGVALSPETQDEILLKDPRKQTVFALARKVGKGRLFVLPSETLSNQRLLEEGNLEFLEQLRRRIPQILLFDERLHGFAKPEPKDSAGTPMGDIFLAQLLLIYLLALLALGKRMGPAWPTPQPDTNALSGLLLRSGATHRRMGHHAEAASAMLERAAEYHRWGEIPRDLQLEAALIRGRNLIDFAHKVAHQQHSRTRR